MALGSFLSRLGSAALPAAISAYGTYRGGEEDERWKGLDPRTSQGLEGFMGAAQAGLSGLQRHEQEERAKKLERERAKQARIANLVGTISPRAGYRPVPVETPKAGALEQVAQLGGAGIGAYKSALEHSRALEDRAQQQRQRQLSIEESERAAEQEKGKALAQKEFATVGELPVQAEEWQQHMRDQGIEPAVDGSALRRKIADIKTPEDLGEYEEAAFVTEINKLAKNKEDQRLDTLQKELLLEKGKMDLLGYKPADAKLHAKNLGKNSVTHLKTLAGDNFTFDEVEPEIRNSLMELYSADAYGTERARGLVETHLAQAREAFNSQLVDVKKRKQKLIADSRDTLNKLGPRAAKLQYQQAIADDNVLSWGHDDEELWAASMADYYAVTDLPASSQEKIARIGAIEGQMKILKEGIDDPDLKEAWGWFESNSKKVQQEITAILSVEGTEKRVVDPEVVEYMNRLGLTAVMSGHLFSGAAVREEEYRRFLNEFLGSFTQGKKVVRDNLEMFDGYLKDSRLSYWNVARKAEGKPGFVYDKNFDLVTEDQLATRQELGKAVDRQGEVKVPDDYVLFTIGEPDGNQSTLTMSAAESLIRAYRKDPTVENERKLEQWAPIEEWQPRWDAAMEEHEALAQTAEVAAPEKVAPEGVAPEGVVPEDAASDTLPGHFQRGTQQRAASAREAQLRSHTKEFERLQGLIDSTQAQLDSDHPDYGKSIPSGPRGTRTPWLQRMGKLKADLAGFTKKQDEVLQQKAKAQSRIMEAWKDSQPQSDSVENPALLQRDKDSLVLKTAINDTATEVTKDDTFTDTALVPTTADSLGATERFLPQINESAENHGVPPDIIRKMIYVESSGRPAIINEDSGSVGLLQITPIAAKDLGIAYDVEQLSDPAYNIEQGTKFLKLQYDRVKRANPNLSEEELWRQAVTAYHAGFGNLQKGNLGPKSRQYPESVFGSNAEEDTMADSLQMTPG